jgi:hypothetical protein
MPRNKLVVPQVVGAQTVPDARLARGQRRGVLSGFHAVSGGLATDEAYVLIMEEGRGTGRSRSTRR